MTPDLVPCPCCEGKGVVPLPPEYQHVLDLVRAGHATARLIRAHTPRGAWVPSPTLANNRLEWLRARGLLERRRSGRGFMYFLPEGPP